MAARLTFSGLWATTPCVPVKKPLSKFWCKRRCSEGCFSSSSTAPASSPGCAQFLSALGNPAAAAELVGQVLAAHPDQVTALFTRAELERIAGQRAAHAATVRHLVSVLRGDPALEFADRIALAWELAAAGANEVVRAQLARGWASAGERDLRRLPPESLLELRRLTRDFPVAVPTALQELADRLAAGDRPLAPAQPR